MRFLIHLCERHEQSVHTRHRPLPRGFPLRNGRLRCTGSAGGRFLPGTYDVYGHVVPDFPHPADGFAANTKRAFRRGGHTGVSLAGAGNRAAAPGRVVHLFPRPRAVLLRHFCPHGAVAPAVEMGRGAGAAFHADDHPHVLLAVGNASGTGVSGARAGVDAGQRPFGRRALVGVSSVCGGIGDGLLFPPDGAVRPAVLLRLFSAGPAL